MDRLRQRGGRAAGLDLWRADRGGRPMILAHRGDSGRAPENTIEAARLGFEAGADGWELDVRLSADGVPVVFHDASLLRTTDVARRFAGDPRGTTGFPVAAFTAAEIRTLDAGGWFVDPAGGPRSARSFGTLDCLGPADLGRFGSGAVRVPTLEEALAFTADAGWSVNVEIKPVDRDGPRLAERVAALIRRLGLADRAWVSSFDHRLIARFAEEAPEIATGALTVRWIPGADPLVRDVLGADAYHPSAEAVLGQAEGDPAWDVRRMSDLPLFVYTVNDATPGGPADRLRALGVAGLFTDRPRELLDAVAGRPEWAGAGRASSVTPPPNLQARRRAAQTPQG